MRRRCNDDERRRLANEIGSLPIPGETLPAVAVFRLSWLSSIVGSSRANSTRTVRPLEAELVRGRQLRIIMLLKQNNIYLCVFDCRIQGKDLVIRVFKRFTPWLGYMDRWNESCKYNKKLPFSSLSRWEDGGRSDGGTTFPVHWLWCWHPSVITTQWQSVAHCNSMCRTQQRCKQSFKLSLINLNWNFQTSKDSASVSALPKNVTWTRDVCCAATPILDIPKCTIKQTDHYHRCSGIHYGRVGRRVSWQGCWILWLGVNGCSHSTTCHWMECEHPVCKSAINQSSSSSWWSKCN